MAVFKTIQREQEAISYVPNSSGTAKLQRNYNYSFILFDLVVNYKAVAGATFKYLNFANLIKGFQITANGSTEYKNMLFSQLIYQTYILTGGKLLSTPPSLEVGDHKCSIKVIVPLASLTMAKPSDTGLISNLFQTLDFFVTWDNENSVGTGITIASAQLRPSSFEKIETVMQGESAPSALKLVQKLQSEQIATSTNGYLVNLPPMKQYAYFQFDLHKGDGSGSAPDTIKLIKFLDGTDVVIQLPVGVIKSFNRMRYDIDDETFKRVYATEISKNQVLNPDAHFIVDFSDRGHYTNSLALKDFKMPQFSLDTDISGLGGVNLNVNICSAFAE